MLIIFRVSYRCTSEKSKMPIRGHRIGLCRFVFYPLVIVGMKNRLRYLV
jgi:hypothetical protein